MTMAGLGVGMLASPMAISQFAAQRTTLENLADVSTIIIAIAILTLLGLLIFAALEMRRGQKKVLAFIEALRGDLAPAIENVNEVSTSLVRVSDAIGKQVDAVDDTLDVANARLRSSVEIAYRRVRHFDALLEVAQEEAESLFTGAAAAVRGVKRGAQAIRGNDHPDRLWDDELEQVIGADDPDDQGHPLTSAEQGPTIHRRRPRHRGPR